MNNETYLEQLLNEQTAPSVLYQQSLEISKDGDEYCVLLGNNLMEGVSGFGKTMRSAMNNFSDNFDNKQIQ